MRTVARAIRRAGDIGEPLPAPYPALERAKVRFRRAGTSVIAGHPGAFKSTFALNLIAKWIEDPDFVAFYVAADGDVHTMSKRMAAILSGDPIERLEEPVREGAYQEYLARFANVHCEWRPLTMKQIDNRLTAIRNMHGKYPDLVVIDNLMNMVDNPTDYSGQMTLCRDLDTMARAVTAHVMILHHTHERPPSKEDGEKASEPMPQPVWEIHGKVSQFPRLILTLAARTSPPPRPVHLMVACVKNTNGPADRTGHDFTDYLIDAPTARVTEV